MLFDIILIGILILVGIGLILLEIFFIPGFGVAGIGGVAFLGVANWFAYQNLGPLAGNLTLALTVVALVFSIYRFIKGKALKKMALNEEITSTAPNTITTMVHPGDEATTISIINPMGSVLINGHRIEAKSFDGFIDVNKKVKIVKVNPTNVVIEQVKAHS